MSEEQQEEYNSDSDMFRTLRVAAVCLLIAIACGVGPCSVLVFWSIVGGIAWVSSHSMDITVICVGMARFMSVVCAMVFSLLVTVLSR